VAAMSEASRHFAPLERQTLPEEIRHRLQDMIAEGVFLPGSRIPSERELCEQFQVARTSVREATQGLISLGLVVRRGNRTYVADELPNLMPDSHEVHKLQVAELFEVRRVIEVPMIEMACCRATDEERAQIGSLAEGFTDGMDLTTFRELDRAFHWALAHASHNSLLAEVYGKVLARLFESQQFSAVLASSERAGAIGTIIASSGKEHRRIANSVKEGSSSKGVKAAEAHLYTVERSIISHLA
jgi:GntR family transcriptional repressor for pyruvate dehydrogenase complex